MPNDAQSSTTDTTQPSASTPSNTTGADPSANSTPPQSGPPVEEPADPNATNAPLESGHLVVEQKTELPPWLRAASALVILTLFGLACLLVIAKIVWSSITHDSDPNDQLVTMVQWTIGTVLTVALGLVGYNWVSSNRSLDREQSLVETRFSLQDERIGQTIAASDERNRINDRWAGEQKHRLDQALIDLEAARTHLNELQNRVDTRFSDIQEKIDLHWQATQTQARKHSHELQQESEQFAQFTAWDMGRKASFALDQNRPYDALFQVCTGIIRLQKEDVFIQRSFWRDSVRILQRLAAQSPIPGLNGVPKLGPTADDAFNMAESIVGTPRQRDADGDHSGRPSVRDSHLDELADLFAEIRTRWNL
ncbi:MAG: hypothetical protein QM589_17260 [Thermomicrobiales bacterium]